MLKLKPVGSNMTELQINGTTVLFSYETPVAAETADGYFRTSHKWSVTTSRHINKWLGSVRAEEKPQEFFDNLAGL